MINDSKLYGSLVKRLNINIADLSIQSADNLLTSRIISLSTIILPIQMFLWKISKKTKSLGEGICSDPGCLPWGSHRIVVHLEDPHPDPGWEWGLHWDRIGGRAVKDSDEDTESQPYGANSEPQHPPWVPHRQRHGDRLPQSQYALAADGYEVGGPLWEMLRFT